VAMESLLTRISGAPSTGFISPQAVRNRMDVSRMYFIFLLSQTQSILDGYLVSYESPLHSITSSYWFGTP
jgi:hypothetical protein